MERLFKISLSISIVGIFIILVISNSLEPKLTSIEDINDLLLGKKVKVEGQVTSIKSYEDSNFQILSLQDETGKIDLTLSPPINITKNQAIIVTGTISEYQGNLQIQAEKIKKIKK
jgi:DNA/RNA endonuclease YhcR with UshA esterase domain